MNDTSKEVNPTTLTAPAGEFSMGLDRDPYHDVPDPLVSLHEEFVRTMPYLDSESRLTAAKYFDKITDPIAGVGLDRDYDWEPQDPLVQYRMLELMYGPEELSAKDIVLGAISYARGQEEANYFEIAMQEFLEDEDWEHEEGTTLEDIYKDQIDDSGMRYIISTRHDVRVLPPRASEPTPPAPYTPRTRRFYKAEERPMVIRGVEIFEPNDIHKLEIPEFKQVWVETTDEVIRAIDEGKHVILGSRRNSGKTHIFPGVLRERAPESWTISEMTNNNLRGGELLMSTSQVFFKNIKKGISIDEAIAEEHKMHGPTPHVRQANTLEPEHKVLVVDETQYLALVPEMLEVNGLGKLVDWAETTNTQLVFITAIADRRDIDLVNNTLNQALQESEVVNINARFERPEYPIEDLRDILVHTGVSPEVIEWWLHDPVAAPLRTMRGVFVMYNTVLQPGIPIVDFYEDFQERQLQSVEEIGKLLVDPTHRDTVAGRITQRTLLNELAGVCAGSGPQMKALAEYFGAPEPDYRYMGYNEGVSAEDII